MAKKLRGEHLRAAMIDTAERIIVSDGLRALTARRVASETGVAIGTTYNVFDNLFELIAEVNARSLDKLAGEIRNLDLESMTARDALVAVADSYLQFVKANRNRWLAVFEVEMPAGINMLPNQRYVDGLFATLEQIVMRYDRKIERETAGLSARGLWAAMHGLLMLSESNRLTALGLPTIGQTMEHLIDCHLQGLHVKLEKS